MVGYTILYTRSFCGDPAIVDVFKPIAL